MQRGRGGGQGGGGLVGAGRDVLDEDRDHRVDRRVGGDVLDRGAEARGRLGGDQLDRARDDGRGRQDLAQRGLRLRRQRRNAEARVDARVRAHDARTARVADDPDAAAARGRLLGQDRRGVEQVVEAVAADHARAGEQRVDGGIRGGDQRAGVRGGRPRAGARPPRLDRQHRLRPRHPPRDAAELARVAERLQIQRDDLGRRVLLPVLQDVVARQIGLVAERDERAQPDAAARHAVDRRRPERPALGDEADRARRARPRARTCRSGRPTGRC